jgi:hypothetical protein
MVYNTEFFKKVSTFLIRQKAERFLHDSLRYLVNDSNTKNIFESNDIIFSHNDSDLAKPGYHILPRWQDDFYEKYIKNANPNNKYYFVNTVNFEPYNVIENMVCKDDARVIMYTSTESDSPREIFDIGLNMRVYVFRHLSLEHMIGSSVFKQYPKKYRLDLTIRNFIWKNERMDLTNKLIQSNKENIFIKINSYFTNIVNQVKNIHIESGQDVPYTIKNEIDFIDNLDKKYIGNELYSEGDMTIHVGALKFQNNTLQSDITILFESNMNWLYVGEPHRWNNFTEKLVDNIMIGKPFIACSKFIIDWCRKHNFEHFGDILGIDYDSIFSHYTGKNDNAYDIVNTLLQNEILRISNMGETEYNELLIKLNAAGDRNREKCFQLFENNDIMDTIINDYNLNFKNTI